MKLGGAALVGSLINGFDPSSTVAQSFVIVANNGTDPITGAFAGLVEGAKFLINNRFFTVSYHGGDGNDVTLRSGGALINGTAGADVIDTTHAPPSQHKATAFDDLINGAAGNDTLDGGPGADTMRGGSATTPTSSTMPAISADENIGGSNGIDIVRSSISFNLADAAHAKGPIENITLLGNATISATGNALGKTLTGNSGANTLRGLAGNDTYSSRPSVTSSMKASPAPAAATLSSRRSASASPTRSMPRADREPDAASAAPRSTAPATRSPTS